MSNKYPLPIGATFPVLAAILVVAAIGVIAIGVLFLSGSAF